MSETEHVVDPTIIVDLDCSLIQVCIVCSQTRSCTYVLRTASYRRCAAQELEPCRMSEGIELFARVRRRASATDAM